MYKFANLRQGELFNKHLQNTKKKQRVQIDLARDTMREGFDTLESRSKQAVDDTHTLLDKSNDAVVTQLQELQDLQNRFNQLMDMYKNTDNNRIAITQQFVDDSKEPSLYRDKNVFVSTLVNNPSSYYYGCFLDAPAPQDVRMIPVLTSANLLNRSDTVDPTKYQIKSSSVYENNQNGYNAVGAFDQNPGTWWHSSDDNRYDSSTGSYTGPESLSYTDTNGATQTAKGEWLLLNLPSPQTATSYTITPRSGFESQRSPNSWILLGFSSEPNSPIQAIDMRQNETFTNGNSNGQNYTIDNPGAYIAYGIIITAVGSDSETQNRISVQMSIDFYNKQQPAITDDQRAMIFDSSDHITYDECMQRASDAGYQFFGMQDVQDDGTAQCLYSNDEFRVQSYGSGDNIVTKILLWNSQTEGYPYAYAQLEIDGRLTVRENSTNKIIFATTGSADCASTYSVTKGVNYPGNDFGGYIFETVEECQAECDSNTNCNGFAFVTDPTDFKNNNTTCWTKSALQQENMYKDDNIDSYSRYPQGTDRSLCKFYCIVQNDGNLCVYKGTGPGSNDGKAVWCSMTNGREQDAHPYERAINGKDGIPYFTQTLSTGERIISEDGTLELVMEVTGNLALYAFSVSSRCTAKNGKIYGTAWTNAVYMLEPTGDPNVMGKMGYVDEKGHVNVYPSDNVQRVKTNNYIKLTDHNSGGNDITYITNTTADDCKTACDNEPNCYGYEFNNNNNQCWIKDANMYPKGSKSFSKGADLYYTAMQPINDDSCNKDVIAIDSIHWNALPSSKNPMTSDKKCGLTKALTVNNAEIANVESDLGTVAQQLVDKIEYLETLNVDMMKQMGVDRSVLDENLVTYKKVASQYGPGTNLDPSNMNNILEDSSLRMTQDNYMYIFWSILAIICILVTIWFVMTMR